MELRKNILQYVMDLYSKQENEINISKFKTFETLHPNGKVYAIDGGSSIILDCGSMIISKIKISRTCYENGKRVPENEETKEFFVVAHNTEKGIKEKIFPEIKLKIEKCKLDEVHNEVRKSLERIEIEKLSENISENDVILADGFFEKIESKSNIVFVCKTSRIFSKGGRSLIGYLNEFAEKNFKNKKWMYPISENEYVVKFHEKSNFCYKVNVKKPENIDYLFGSIAFYSSDPEIIGYPYPLLKVDKIARIRHDEKKIENRKIKHGEFGKILRNDENAAIMHEMLDKRMYR